MRNINNNLKPTSPSVTPFFFFPSFLSPTNPPTLALSVEGRLVIIEPGGLGVGVGEMDFYKFLFFLKVQKIKIKKNLWNNKYFEKI